MLFRMLHQFIVLTLSVFFFSPVFAASIDDQIQPLAKSSLLLDITSTGSKLVAVGERGHVLLQQGDDWQQVNSSVDTLLTKVFFLDQHLGWAVGHDATIIHTRDGGRSWQIQMQSIKLEKPFLDVLFFNRTEGIAVGAYGLFFRTRDGGKTWTEEFHDELLFAEDLAYLNELKQSDNALYLSERSYLLPHFNRIVMLNNGNLLLVGELGLAAISYDQGRSFEILDFVYDGSMFNAIEVLNQVYVMGLRGHIFKADQSLQHWQELSLPVMTSVNAALVDEQHNVWFVGNAGMVLKMTPEGDLKQVIKHQGENITALAKDGRGNIWLTSSAGLMLLED